MEMFDVFQSELNKTISLEYIGRVRWIIWCRFNYRWSKIWCR